MYWTLTTFVPMPTASGVPELTMLVGLILGVFVIVGSVVIPSPLPIGMYWLFGLAALFGISAGFVKEANVGSFVTGILAGYVAIFIYNLAFLTHLSFVLAAVNLGAVAVGITSFIISKEKRISDS